jgi:hypothetical protein
MGAPVCKINPAPPVFPSKPLVLPAIPVATDLASLIAAVNALRQAFIAMNGQVNPNNTPGSPGGGFTANWPANKQGKANSFTEVRPQRVTTTNRIYDPNNKQNYVDVQQITGLTFVDPTTQQTWTWSQ